MTPHTNPGASGDGKPLLTMYRPYTPDEARETADQLTQELGRIARKRLCGFNPMVYHIARR